MKRKNERPARIIKSRTQAKRPQTLEIAPACVFRRVASLVQEDKILFLVSDEKERIPLAGIETPDVEKAKKWLEDNVEGAWIKICHPRLLPMGKSLAGIIYVEPKLKSVQERMVQNGSAILKK